MDPDLAEIVICFMVSGDARYVEMTLRAVRSFQESCPGVAVGLLVQKGFDYSFFLAQLPNPSNVHIKFYSQRFEWNPTQYKLDIIQFTDKFKTIFWMDSDVIVHRDLSNFLLAFHQSNKNYAFTLDHVNHSEDFRRRWPGNRDNMFIPQACFMGFKAETMRPFFQEWENVWKEWITPFPFSKYPDPNPSFPNSYFCIEQYALGMVLERLVENMDFQIFIIPREQLFVRNVTEAIEAVSANPQELVSGLSSLSIAGPFSAPSTATSYGWTSSYRISSYYLARSSYAPTSYAQTSYRPTSYGLTSYRPTSYGLTSYGPTSYGQTSYGQTSYSRSSYSTTSYGVTSYGVSSYGVTSYGVSSYGTSSYRPSSSGASSYTTTSYTGSSYGGATSSYRGVSSLSTTAPPIRGVLVGGGNVSSTQQLQQIGQVEGVVGSPSTGPADDRLMVDHLASGVVHYYSVNFENFFVPPEQQQQQQK